MASTSTVADELMTPEELAAAVKKDLNTIRWWRYKGIGPRSFKLSERVVRYRKSDVDAWLKERYTESK